MQTIIDKLAEKIMRELVSNSSLTQTLANYMTTAMMSGEQINDGNKVPTSALAFAMNQAITQNKNAITQLNSEHIPYVGNISNYGTMEALFSAAQNNNIKIGIYQWNTELRPDNTNGIAFIGNWDVMAFSTSGKNYHIFEGKWVLMNS